MGPLPTKQDRDDLTVRLQAVRTAVTPRIKELRDAEEWKRWANVQVQEELCTKMEALDSGRRHRAGEGGERDAHAAGAVEERRRRAALAGRNAVDALQGRAGPGLREVQGLLRAAGGRASGESEEEGSAVRARRSAGRFDRLGAHRRRHQGAAGRVEDDRPGDARPRKVGVGALPRRLRSSSSRAGRRTSRSASTSGRTTSPRRKRSSPKPSSSRSRPSGTRPPAASSSCRPSGRRSARSARTSPKSSGSASAPPATRSSSATRRATRSRSPASLPIAKPRSRSSRRSCRRPTRLTRRCRTISTPRSRPRARAICRGPSCRATRWRRSRSA